jgi:DnaJ-class molecular chaperone
VSSKSTKCQVCNGKGKIYVYNFGAVIHSEKCDACKGTGKTGIKNAKASQEKASVLPTVQTA